MVVDDHNDSFFDEMNWKNRLMMIKFAKLTVCFKHLVMIYFLSISIAHVFCVH